jgi:hypothetical protein
MKNKYHGNIKCDCGEKQDKHYNGEGACKVNACTYFYPNFRYVLRKTKK